MKADGLLGCLINKLIDMKRIAFILLFLSSLSVFGQETWNVCSQTVNVIPQPSYDSTFVLSAPSRAALAKGMASWTASSSSSASYLVYTALLNQTGTDAPVATVLENTLGGTVVWTYDSPGVYIGTLSGAFTANKTIILCQSLLNTNGDFPDAMRVIRNDANTVQVTSFANNSLDAGANGVLIGASLEIRVYP